MPILTGLPLRRRIMVLVTGGLGLTLVILAVVGIEVVAQSTDRVLQDRLVLVRVAAADLDERLRVAQSRLTGLAAALPWDLQASLAPEAQRLLTLSESYRGLFSGGFLVLDVADRVLWPERYSGLVLSNATPPGAGPGLSGLIRLPGDVPAVVMWVPRRDGAGMAAGTLGGIIDLRGDALTELIAPLAIGRTGHAVIIDRDGIVLAGTEARERFTRGDHPDFFIALLRRGHVHIERTPEIEDGVAAEQHVMAFAPLFAGTWGLGFGQAEWEVYLPERALQKRMAFLGLLLLALGLVFSWRDTGIITAPLRRLTSSAQRIAEGNLEIPILPEPGYEVGMLAGALETMRGNILRMRVDLEQRAHVIERQRRRAEALYEVSRAILSEADLGSVLSVVTGAARSLLGADAAAVCLWDHERRSLVPGGFSGPERAFRAAGGAAACEAIPVDGTWRPLGDCPFLDPAVRQSHLTASLHAGDQLIGVMCVGSGQHRQFSEEDQTLFTALTGLGAIAIHSAQLREQVQLMAALEERERIARDLHDNIIQSLYGISLILERAQNLAETRPAAAALHLDHAVETIARMVRDVRTFVTGLQPGDDGHPVAEALGRIVREFRVDTMLPVDFRCDGDLPDLPADERLHLQLLLREALANASRHAAPARVTVDLGVRDGEVRMAVTDDGRGFDPENTSAGRGLGLGTMVDRARRLGGVCEIRSSPGAGTTVEVRFPVPEGGRGANEPTNRRSAG